MIKLIDQKLMDNYLTNRLIVSVNFQIKKPEDLLVKPLKC